MKKSLSFLLAIAMVFGLFASVVSAADSTTELTAQQKFDALKAKGIFAGINDAGDAGLDQEMNRAQFARVAALILGLDGIGATDTKVVTEKPFSDVELGKWYTEEVAAVKEAGVMVGNPDGTFTPVDSITVQQLAVVSAQLLGLEKVEDATVDGAADWAAGYIQAIINAGVPFPTNYTDNATRAQLVEASFTADALLNPVAPAKVSVVSAKATGVQKVEVVLDKAVDTEKATLTLKRGTATVATKTVWSEDKKSATLELSSTKIAEGDYSVTLAGLDAEAIATASASFKGEAEKVVKIDFITTSDEIALTNIARVKLRAENQYGEAASFGAASYTVTADTIYGAQIKKDSEGNLVVELDTDVTGVTPGMTMIPLYVYNNDNHVTASKTFKLGFAPFITKLELGDELTYSNGKDSLVSVGDTVTAQLRLYDQYGNPMTKSQGVPTFNKNIAPFTNDINVTFDDYDGDDEFEVRASLTAKADASADYSATVYAGSANGTFNFKVTSSKVATKVDFETYNGTIATGDANKYVKLIVTDANGETLTPSEIADNAGRIAVSATGVTGTVKIITVGPHKGEIILPSINAVAKSFVFVTASILTPNANSFKTYQIPVADARVPSSLVVDTKPKAKAVLGANTDFKILVKDQYGDNVGGTQAANTYKVVLDFTGAASGIQVTDSTAGGLAAIAADGTTDVLNFGTINDGLTFDTVAGTFGTASLKATLQKYDGTTWKDVSSAVSVSTEAIDPATSTLTYSLSDVSEMYAALSSGLLPAVGDVDGDTTANTENDKIQGSLPHKALSLVVKDSAGNAVAYPDYFTSVSTSNSNVAKVSAVSSAGGKAYVLGNKAGDATVSAVVYKANGETATLSTTVTVKSDVVVADKVAANGDKSVAVGDIVVNTSTVQSSAFMNVKVTDQYGIAYTAAQVSDYDDLLGVRYSVSEVSGATVTINAKSGLITAFTDLGGDGEYQFVVTATAPNGKSASTLVYHN